MFRAIADAERVHATRHLSLVEDILVKDTDTNLEKYFQCEKSISEIVYPDFIKDAEQDGVETAALVFSQARDAETFHVKLYEQIKEAEGLLNNRPIQSQDHENWNNTTREYLIKCRRC